MTVGLGGTTVMKFWFLFENILKRILPTVFSVFLSAGCCGDPHVHLWSTASQKVNQSWVEGHDGITHVNYFSFFLPRSETHIGHCDNSVTQKTSLKTKEEPKTERFYTTGLEVNQQRSMRWRSEGTLLPVFWHITFTSSQTRSSVHTDVSWLHL